MIYAVLFIFGLAVGSFLNVVIFRYNPEKSVFDFRSWKGRSRCPHCQKKLNWYELIPVVSFIVQKGKCRKCNKKISWQYPLVEILSGAVFGGVPLFLSNFYGLGRVPVDISLFYALAAVWILVFVVWLLIIFIDRLHYIIPNELNVVLLALGFFVVTLKNAITPSVLPFHTSFLKQFLLIFSPSQGIWFNHILGALAAGLFFTFLITISRGKAMGWGDAKLAFTSGFVVGWPEIALSLILAFVLGGAWGGSLLVLNKKKLSDKLPFAPFLVVGMVISIFAGYPLIQWYFNFLGI